MMFESVPTYPDPGRYWRLVDDLGIDIFYTAPTALRAIAQAGNEWVERYKRTSLRVLGSVGEPINPEIWKWYHDVVGNRECAVVDTWWQTETGGILITPLAGITELIPGYAMSPMPIFSWYQFQASGFMGSPTEPSSLRELRSCFSAQDAPYRIRPLMAVGEVYKMFTPYFSTICHHRFGYGWFGAPSYRRMVAPLMSGP